MGHRRRDPHELTMPGTYDATATRALGTITRKGAPVTFTFARGDGTYLADIDFESYAGPVSVFGYAIRDETTAAPAGAPITREGGTLIETESPVLLFAPSTPGQLPAEGMLVAWGGHTYSVVSVDPIAPAGKAVIARVVVRR